MELKKLGEGGFFFFFFRKLKDFYKQSWMGKRKANGWISGPCQQSPQTVADGITERIF